MTSQLLEVDGLDVKYSTNSGDVHAVTDASFTIGSNEYFGLVGESGCGKSTLADAVLNALDANGKITAGTVKFQGEKIQGLSEKEYNNQLRWKEIAVIPQSAMNSLDPLTKVSEQAVKVSKMHTDWSEKKAVSKLKELFNVMGLPESRVDDYPHQFSGGMSQRVIIAFSLLLEPALIIADEPTTALDVIMQDQFLKHLDELREIRDFSLLFITHDIAVVFEICDSMAVMHGGQFAEQGSTTAIFDESRHPYTILLQQAFPDIRYPNRELDGIEGTPPRLDNAVNFCTFADRCPWSKPECREGAPPSEPVPDDDFHEVSCIRSNDMTALAEEYLEERQQPSSTAPANYTDQIEPESSVQFGPKKHADGERRTVLELQGLQKYFTPSTNIVSTLRSKISGNEQKDIRAVDGVELALKEDQIQGVIGESGCGKTTLLETIIGKLDPDSGEIRFNGQPVSEFDKEDWKNFRQRVQIIFQDPYNTLNPNFTVRDTLMEPLRIHDKERSEEQLLEMLETVQLTPAEEYITRSESQLSGGEKQRVSIARALILEPDVILADEPVSMLDVSTQASILDLLKNLTYEYDTSLLYISHDLSTVSNICDRINVMYLGRIIESAPTSSLINDPKHPYTQSLINAIPIPDPHHDREWAELPGRPGDGTALPTGCRFKDRCSERMEVCDKTPVFEHVDDQSHQVACHLHTGNESTANTESAMINEEGDLE